MGTLSLGVKWPGVRLNTVLHLIPPYAIMDCTETTLLLQYPDDSSVVAYVCSLHKTFYSAMFMYCLEGLSKYSVYVEHLLSVTWLRGGTWWRSWLRHCATSWKVAGLIPDGVTGIFHWHNPSSCTMALGLTQPLTEMSTRNISWG
jgi:hypothetical protein